MTDPLRPDRTRDPQAPSARGRALQRGAFVRERAGRYDTAALAQAMATFLADPTRYPRDDTRVWVPIGPSVVRSADPEDFRRTTGRVRDLAVSTDGRRAYAATAKGGLWYTGDAAATWTPVGAWATRTGAHSGANSMFASGALLVLFGPTVADDFVLVGTGEYVRSSSPYGPDIHGLGVLAASGPADPARPVGPDPWERQSGLDIFEGRGIFRLAREPGALTTAGGRSIPRRVLAATHQGLVLGVRSAAGDHYTWTSLPALTDFAGYTDTDDTGVMTPTPPIVCDVLWLPGGDNGRIVVALARDFDGGGELATGRSGVAYSDDLGASFHWIDGLNPLFATDVLGRTSLAHVDGRVYVLGARDAGPYQTPSATVWRIASIADTAPAATRVRGVPDVWSSTWTPRHTQRDYDQAIAAVSVTTSAGTVDRIYLGGSYTVISARGEETKFVSSLWCLQARPGGTEVWLDPVPGVSRSGEPPVGDGARFDGLIGYGVHADVHIIRVVGDAGHHQTWVGCDGGVFVSPEAGRVSTFAPRVMGIAALETNFVTAHPTSSHFVAIGTQDNGVQVRTGDAVWQIVGRGDGGGVAFHPHRSHLLVSQYAAAAWNRAPRGRFIPPVQDGAQGKRESHLSFFYSGAAVTPRGTEAARFAIGTNRVWVSDNIEDPDGNTWGVLPYQPHPGAFTQDPRFTGDPMSTWNFGVPQGGPLAPAVFGEGPLGAVVTVRWNSSTELLVLFEKGVVRWTQAGTGHWSARLIAAATDAPPPVAGVPPLAAGTPDPAQSRFSDLCPVPGGQDFYLATVGKPDTAEETCYHYSDATNAFTPTGLRGTLGPVNPAYAVTVDPTDPSTVYVGTAAGVWRGARGATGTHTWQPMVNGLPQALVQDLNIWVDPSGAPRLLRAAIQSRGVWETDLAATSRPPRTFLRVHSHDDRRHLPTPLANPRRPPGSAHLPTVASPDIVVRPGAGVPPPTWGLEGRTMRASSDHPYELWTFQTAFRWHYPSLPADGRWSDAFGDLVRRHRLFLGLSNEVIIDRALWDAVVGREAAGTSPAVPGTRLDPTTLAVTTDPAHPPAVHRAPWHTRGAPDVSATEADLLEYVIPPSIVGDVWQVYREPTTVEVLLHHRDSRIVAPDEAFVLLLWRHAARREQALAGVGDVPTFAAQVLAAEHADQPPASAPSPAALPAQPTDWTLPLTADGRALHRLPVALDARMPRAASIEVNLGAVPRLHYVAFLAVAASRADLCAAPAVGLSASASATDLVTRWPYAALRLVRVRDRRR